MQPKELLQSLAGTWNGNCQTWFEPGKLADESTIAGEIAPVLDGLFLRHTYESTIQGKPRHGEELIAFNGVANVFESSWIDDFHMSTAIMFSVGEATTSGFSVLGSYDVGDGHPKWGWRTAYHLVDSDHLTITSFNVDPAGTESKAVETLYRRTG